MKKLFVNNKFLWFGIIFVCLFSFVSPSLADPPEGPGAYGTCCP
jgi:hypothetical protein